MLLRAERGVLDRRGESDLRGKSDLRGESDLRGVRMVFLFLCGLDGAFLEGGQCVDARRSRRARASAIQMMLAKRFRCVRCKRRCESQ